MIETEVFLFFFVADGHTAQFLFLEAHNLFFMETLDVFEGVSHVAFWDIAIAGLVELDTEDGIEPLAVVEEFMFDERDMRIGTMWTIR